jgi:hypothetical protein
VGTRMFELAMVGLIVVFFWVAVAVLLNRVGEE